MKGILKEGCESPEQVYRWIDTVLVPFVQQNRSRVSKAAILAVLSVALQGCFTTPGNAVKVSDIPYETRQLLGIDDIGRQPHPLWNPQQPGRPGKKPADVPSWGKRLLDLLK